MPTSDQIRQQFIDFFVEKHKHTFVPSSPVVPHDDPTLLFANAGMNQFKPYFLGTETAPWPRAANTQKSIRAGGKHNDLDDVGRSRRHHTFFEMLGNWSFGDYFKEGAISMAWELLTEVWQIDPKRLHVSCYEGDEAAGIPRDTEAAEIWKRVAKLPDERIHYFGKDNFWEMGETGPCGPCTEIHIDRTPDLSGGNDVNGEDPRVMEIWNLVFIQYNRDASGKLSALPAQHVDTGMGFERICQVLQDKQDNFGIDLWTPLFDHLSRLSGHKYTGQFTATNSVDPKAESENPQLRTDIAFRVVADHTRCLTFALTDGASPSNEGRGYVLRRILRRAVRFGRQQLGFDGPFIYKLVPTIAESMGQTFPELREQTDRVVELIKDEEESFGKTLDRGIALFDEAAQRATNNTVSGDDAFTLHDTYGFPLDLTRVMAEERGMSVDVAGFEERMEEARQRARGATGQTDARSALVEIVQKQKLPETEFTGHSCTQAQVQSPVFVFTPQDAGFAPADAAEPGQDVAVALAVTPFYAEAGGQVGDTGRITTDDGAAVQVEDTLRVGGVIFHIGKVEKGTLRASEQPITLNLAVDENRRDRTMANHTSTHILNHALREVLGEHVQQKGSLVDPDKLRFDFSHNQALDANQIEQIERLANQTIDRDLPVYFDEAPLTEARKIHGLRAVFGEKYPDHVRVVSIGKPVGELLAEPEKSEWRDYSVEFCGGTHLPRTGLAKAITVTAEEAVAKGVRRLTALTGDAARQAMERASLLSQRLEALQEAPAENIERELTGLQGEVEGQSLPARARQALRGQLAQLQKKVKDAQKQKSAQAAGAAVDQARQIAEQADDGPIVASLGEADAGALRTAMDVIRKKKPDAPLLLAGVAGDKLVFVAAVPEPYIKQGLKAGDWVREVAKATGGGGGGRPDMAQAGGKDVAKLDDALALARDFASTRVG